MNAKRKKVQEFIIKYINKIDPSGENKKLYETMFKEMNDKEFDQLMKDIRDGKTNLSVVAPNKHPKIKLDVERNMKIGKELGFGFFQRLIIGPKDKESSKFKTKEKYLILNLPYRRQSQLLIKKLSIPEDNHTVDLLTGQVTGKSKAGTMTFPEIQLLAGLGMDKTLKELLGARGGDKGRQRALEASLDKYGIVKQELIDQYSTEVQSTKTLQNYFTGMHLKANFRK